jgi:hypothetical protein
MNLFHNFAAHCILNKEQYNSNIVQFQKVYLHKLLYFSALLVDRTNFLRGKYLQLGQR